MAARKDHKRARQAGAPPCGDRGEASACLCRRAVTRAFYEMRLNAASPAEALAAAVRVYNYHHPGFAPAEAQAIIQGWLTPRALN
jgi:hypothetical protein